MPSFIFSFSRAKSERINAGQWTTTHGQPITKPRFDPTSLASSKNRSNATGDQPQLLGRKKLTLEEVNRIKPEVCKEVKIMCARIGVLFASPNVQKRPFINA